jgi:hypothetical protein
MLLTIDVLFFVVIIEIFEKQIASTALETFLMPFSLFVNVVGGYGKLAWFESLFTLETCQFKAVLRILFSQVYVYIH